MASLNCTVFADGQTPDVRGPYTEGASARRFVCVEFGEVTVHLPTIASAAALRRAFSQAEELLRSESTTEE